MEKALDVAQYIFSEYILHTDWIFRDNPEQSIVHLGELIREIVDFRSEYEDICLKDISKMEEVSKEPYLKCIITAQEVCCKIILCSGPIVLARCQQFQKYYKKSNKIG